MEEKDSEDGGESCLSVQAFTLRRLAWPTDLVWVAQDDHLCHFSRASGWKRVPAGGPHV